MKTNPIPGVMDTLKEANFDEVQRMAITKSIADMQYPLLEAIENLETKMDARFEKLEARFESLSERFDDHRADMKSDVVRLTDRLDSQTLALTDRLGSQTLALTDRLTNQTLVLAGTVIASHLGVLAILKLF